MAQVLALVRLHVVVPPRAPRGDHHLPRDAGHRGVHLENPQRDGEGLRHEPQRRVRVLSRVVRRRRHLPRRVPHRRVQRLLQQRGHRRHGHVRHPRAHHAVCRRRLRQRKPRRHRDVPHVLRLVPRASQQIILVDWGPRGPSLRLHGRRVGRIHLRAKHGGPARRDARYPRAVQRIAAQGVLAVLDRGDPRRDPVPRGGPGAHQVHGAARAHGGVPGHAGVGVRRADREAPQADWCGGMAPAHQCLRRWRRCARRGHPPPRPDRILRPPLRACARAVRQAHQDGQPPGGLGGGTPARHPRRILALLALPVLRRPRGLRHLARALPQHPLSRRPVPPSLRRRGILLRQPHGAPDHLHGAHRLLPHWDRHRLPCGRHSRERVSAHCGGDEEALGEQSRRRRRRCRGR
mmetsp:Transcript_6346/g.15807  ORF Transcript_6346/g.15807 Transcript_6346/m.15807 type:complete len:405 (-) Transcript_6346:1277-2491(-)